APRFGDVVADGHRIQAAVFFGPASREGVDENADPQRPLGIRRLRSQSCRGAHQCAAPQARAARPATAAHAAGAGVCAGGRGAVIARTDAGVATVSLRRRVTAATVSVFALVLVAVIIVVNGAFAVILNRSVTAVLNDHVQLAQQLARENTPPSELVNRLETRSVRARLVLSDGQVFGNLRGPAAAEAGAKVRRLRLTNASGPLAGAQLT